jgi:plastocyanin
VSRPGRRPGAGGWWWLAASLLAASPAVAGAQSTLERGPNLEGAWVPPAGVVQFNFLHRFRVVGDNNRVINSPTLLLAAGVPGNAVVGTRYASNSLLVGGRPNEWEVFGRWAPLREVRGAPVDVGVQVAHNGTADSVDGEVVVGRSLGPVRALVGARGFSALGGEGSEAAVVAGGVLRLSRRVAVAADVADVLGRGGRAGWSAGLQLEIPYTPHALSLHVSNVNATTLQSGVLGHPERRWGFEFTVPVTLRRYVGERAGPEAAPAPAAALVDMDNLMRYLPDTVRIAVGEAVRWRNGSDIVHTVTAEARRAELSGSVRLPAGATPFDSGDMRPGEEFVHRFTVPGEYVYFCVPHERAGMVGVVVVE